jgi:hypothetical protein
VTPDPFLPTIVRERRELLMNKSRFEGVVVEGIGDLRALAGVSADELGARLAPERYALVTATGPIPVGWPSELFRNSPAEFEVDGQRESHEINTWYFAETGGPWRKFYAFSLTVYVQRLNSVPAFIYERLTNNAGVSYQPVVSLLLSLDGRVRQASRSWCDAVRADRMRGA